MADITILTLGATYGTRAKRGVVGSLADRIERFSRSGLTVNEFCEQEGVSLPSYNQWKKRFSIGTGSTNDRRQSGSVFVPIQIRALSGIEVHLLCGSRIVIPSHDHDAIQTVVRVLLSVGAENRSC